MDWSKLPDLAAVTLLTCAFASVARRSQAKFTVVWVSGWLTIVLHFAAFLLLPATGRFQTFVTLIGLASLTWAGVLFMWAAVPYRVQASSWAMLAILLFNNTLYLALILISGVPAWALDLSAFLMGALPLALTLFVVDTINHPLRWVTTGIYCGLSAFLLLFQNRPGNGSDLALNAVLFTVYLGCTLHFWFTYRRATAGALVTIAGFLTWAAVFVLAPFFQAVLPALHVESEVWNLPKYVVAVGMILLVLEDQIEHNKFLALHDELTGLPNRRLFQDRLGIALERARRTGSQMALLLVDLDHFKQVNDTHGHHIGDMLLRRVANLFVGRVRRTDTVARTGGDEFSIILDEPTSRENATSVADSLIQLLQEPLSLDDHSVRVGASVGVAVFPEDALTQESLCIAADVRMYEEKNASRHTGQRPHPTRPRYASASEAESSLHSEWI